MADDSVERKAKKRGGRVPILTASEKKRRKKQYDQKLAKSRVYIGSTVERWKSLKSRINAKTDEDAHCQYAHWTVCIQTNIVLIVQEMLWYEFQYALYNALPDIRLFAIIQQQIMLKEFPPIFPQHSQTEISLSWYSWVIKWDTFLSVQTFICAGIYPPSSNHKRL